MKVTVRSSNPKVTKPRQFNLQVGAGATVTRTISVKVPRVFVKQAKLFISVASGADRAQAVFTLKPPKKQKRFVCCKGDVKILANQNTQQL